MVFLLVAFTRLATLFASAAQRVWRLSSLWDHRSSPKSFCEGVISSSQSLL